MKKVSSILCSMSLMALIVTGCATVTKGPSQMISINSNVSGANVFVDGQLVGTTPFSGKVKKGGELVKVEKSGYVTATVALSKSLEPTFWGNIIIGGTLGSVTDFASGSAYSYAPASYQVDLKANGQASDDFKREFAIRKFSMIYMDNISQDIAKGGGDYLSALLTMLEDFEVAATDSVISSAIVESKGNQADFGDILVGLM